MAKQDLRLELFYDQQWNDHATDVYVRDDVKIGQGFANESGQPAPSSMGLTFKSPNGELNPANPAGALWGKIGRNTPARASLNVTDEDFEDATLTIAVTDAGDAAWARASDQAHTGTWSFKSGTITHGQTSDAVVTVPAGAPALTFWHRVSSEPLFDFLDVYVDAELVIHRSGEGDWAFSHLDVSGATTVTFRYLKDADTSTGDDAAWIDDLRFADVRFTGEASAWNPRTAVKGDAWVKIAAAGISRRLGQGAAVVRSAPRTYYTGQPDVAAYWPIEEGSLSQGGAPAAGSGSQLRSFTWLGAFGSYLFGDPLPSLGRSRLAPWLPDGAVATGLGGAVTMTGTPGSYVVEFMFATRSQDGLLTIIGNGVGISGAEQTNIAVPFLGAANNYEVWVDDGTVQGYLLDPPEVVPPMQAFDGQPHHLRFSVEQVNVDELRLRLYLDSALYDDRTFAGEPVILDGVAIVGIQGMPDGSAVGQLAVRDGIANLEELPAAVNAAFGFPGEPAGRRIERLCIEQGVPLAVTGDLDDTTALGPQYTEGFLAVLREAAAVDMGLLLDDPAPPELTGLHYRTRASLYSQPAALELDFAAGGELAPPLEPATDDRITRNDITVKRRDGSSHRAVDEDSIDTVGRVDIEVTVNLADDGLLAGQAAWRLHVAISDAERFPRISVDLDAAPALAASVAALRPGDRLDLVNLPATISGQPDVSLMVLGWSETIGSHRRLLTFNCAPYESWLTGVWDDSASRYSTDGSVLAEALDTTETGVDVDTPSGPPWSHVDGNFGIMIGGERMTVTAIAAPVGTVQTFTVTRSVNGVVKTHSNGDAVHLWPPTIYAL